MNEILFFFHLLIAIGFGWGALRLGPAALTAWAALQAVLANLFVLKQMVLFGFHITCSDVYAIGSVLGLNLLREYYGKESAQRALSICFWAMLFFAAMAQLHLWYLPSPFDTTQPVYHALLSPSPRLFGASLFVYLLVQQIDLKLFGALKNSFTAIPLALRNGISLCCTQLLDTVLFSLIGLWGLVSSLSDIIAVSFAVKILIVAFMTPLVAFSRRFVHGRV